MTEKEVRWLLGEPSIMWTKWGGICGDFAYHRYGVQVHFTDGRVTSYGAFRVEKGHKRPPPPSDFPQFPANFPEKPGRRILV
jgi:hypothetical protein